uniref:Cytochrome b561 domain-containing protein n=1 Tax=Stomoxys calcitrans TaxID=35570 RepID=A0A1I8P3I8_STOCA
MAAKTDVEKNVSTENSNISMMTVEIPVITPVVPSETMTITTNTTTTGADAMASSPPPPPPSTAPPSNGTGDEVDFKKMDINDQLQQNPPPMVTTTVTIITKGKMDTDPAMANFKVLYVLTQLCGLTMIVLMGSWIGVHMGGLGGTGNPSLEFNWHPLLMTIGLIFLYGNAILVYRGLRTLRKKTLKLTHAALHMGAFILTVIALKTVFDSHNLAKDPIPNMYSLHSWLGLSAVLIFSLQYVIGFTAYLVPGAKESFRAALMPLHVYFGLFGFVLAVASACMGITEKAIFSLGSAYSTLPSSAVMVNLCGVLFVVFGGLV